MSAAPRLRGMLVAVVLALAAMFAAASGALGAGIQFDRSISPPQAVVPGSGTQVFTFNITFTSTANRYEFTVFDPNGTQVSATEVVSTPGAQSPIAGTRTWTPPAGTPAGRYQAEVRFFSSTGFEAQARVTFDVAAQLGSLRLVKFEDLNGNGSRDGGEPGVPNWTFNLTNPQGNPSDARTGTDGTVTIDNVPAGTWRADEVIQNGWVPVTPPGGTVVVPAGGTGTFTAGNARPAPLSGTVWLDTNSNGRIDAGENGRAGVTLTLTGTTGLGTRVSETTVSTGDGSYVFPELMPGTYSVRMTTPGGFTATTAIVRNGRMITSNVGNPNNNFGLIAGSGVVTQTPDVTIDKRGPATALRGQVFTYTIVVRNNSTFAARNVEVTDLVPANLTLVAIPAGATIRNGVVTWSLGTLQPGASRTLRMRVRVNPTTNATRLVNTATVTATGLPPKRDTVTTRLRNPPPTRRIGGVTG